MSRDEFAKLEKKIEQLLEENKALKTKNEDLQSELQKAIAIHADVVELNKHLKESKELAEEAVKTQGKFLANMSHELRTPLNGILGYVQILKSNKQVMKIQQALAGVKTIENCGRHLLNLINDILDMSKIEAQKMELQYSNFLLQEMLSSIIVMMRIPAEKKGLKIYFKAPVSLPKAVYGDEKRLSQVLLNLLSNAIKFTSNGSVTLKVSLMDYIKAKEQLLSKLLFEVIDTGMGIPKDKQEEIFSPFQQIANHTRNIEGTGLGLSISRKFVQLMHGDLIVESTVNKGSTFKFEIILPTVKEWYEEPGVLERSIIGYEGVRHKILVVDDKEENRHVLVNLLLPLGFIVEEASDGKECLEKVEKLRPGLIFLDLIMPVMNGFETIKKIREIPLLQNTKIIAISASAFFAFEETQEHGFDDFLLKPIELTSLFEKLKKYLQLTWQHRLEKTTKKILKATKDTTREFFVAEHDAKEKLPELIKLLKEKIEYWKEIRHTLIINQIEEFAASIEKLGMIYKCSYIVEWGKNLQIQASSFELASMQETLESFPEAVQKLETSAFEQR